MFRQTPNQVLRVASLIAFGAALVLLVPSLERLIAAMWQWYKFAGYSDDGHIALSFRTGLLFSWLLIAVFGLAWWLNRWARRDGDRVAVRCSALAMCLVISSFLTYWLLGMSRLNVWHA